MNQALFYDNFFELGNFYFKDTFLTHDKPTSVLIIEDDPFMSKIWSKMIKNLNEKILIDLSETYNEAEYFLEQNTQYDLVIADIYLAGSKTGFDLWMKYGKNKHDSTWHFSSKMDKKRFQRYLTGETIVPEYTQKPINLNECKEMLKDVLQI